MIDVPDTCHESVHPSQSTKTKSMSLMNGIDEVDYFTANLQTWKPKHWVCIDCKGEELRCSGSFFLSPCRRRALPETQRDRHDPQSANEDLEDDDKDCSHLCGVLDPLLPAGDLVLVPATDAPGHPGVCAPRPLCLRQPQHLLRPNHLRVLHPVVPRRPGALLAQAPPEHLTQIFGPPLGSQGRGQRGCRVRPRQWWPAKWKHGLKMGTKRPVWTPEVRLQDVTKDMETYDQCWTSVGHSTPWNAF